MNVTEQSMLSRYASGEILSARQKADNGRPEGLRYRKAKLSETRQEVPRRKKRRYVSRLLVTGDTPTVTAVCGLRLADRISFFESTS